MKHSVDLARCPTKVVAAVLGLTIQTVRNRFVDGIYQQTAKGKYDLVAVAEAERKVQQDGRKSNVVSLETAKLRRAQAERAELENAVKRGEVIPAEDVERITSETMATVVRSLAVQFKVSGGVEGRTYRIRVSGTTDASPAQTVVVIAKLRVVADGT